MRALDDFIAYVAEDVPSQPSFIVRRAVLASAREFCKETLCWQEDVDVQFSEQNTAVINLPELAEFHSVIEAGDMDYPLQQNQHYTVNIIAGTLKWLDGRAPTTPVNFSVALFPDSEADKIPDFLYKQFRDAKAAGAAFRFAGRPNVDMRQYRVYELQEAFRTGKHDARDVALNGRRRLAAPIKHHFF